MPNSAAIATKATMSDITALLARGAHSVPSPRVKTFAKPVGSRPNGIHAVNREWRRGRASVPLAASLHRRANPRALGIVRETRVNTRRLLFDRYLSIFEI